MAPSLICSVEHCGKPTHIRGLCSSHYKRLMRHGDPLAGGTAVGAPMQWVREVAIPFSGTDCLKFPFSRDDYGYGKIRVDGRNKGVHVIVCAAKHGPKPSPRHEACHSCGKGHEGCVNPNHVRWGTRVENMSDAIAHGTLKNRNPLQRGERAPSAKFSDALVDQVRELIAQGVPQPAIARATGISQSHVSAISRGRVRRYWGVFA